MAWTRRVFSEGTSDILNTALTGIVDPVVYGVFNTPVNAIGGSAVCMFNISDVIETFMGSFKDQEAMDSNWLPVKKVRNNNKCGRPRRRRDFSFRPHAAYPFVRRQLLLYDIKHSYSTLVFFGRLVRCHRRTPDNNPLLQSPAYPICPKRFVFFLQPLKTAIRFYQTGNVIKLRYGLRSKNYSHNTEALGDNKRLLRAV